MLMNFKNIYIDLIAIISAYNIVYVDLVSFNFFHWLTEITDGYFGGDYQADGGDDDDSLYCCNFVCGVQ